MKYNERAPRKYTVFYQFEGWGTGETEVTAIDIKAAIDQVLDSLYGKFGTDKPIYIVRVV